MKNIIGVVATIIIALVPIVLGFGITGLIVKGICWAFNFAFSWRLAFGVWLVLLLVSSIFGGTKYVKKVN